MDWLRLESYGYWVVFVPVFLAVAMWESARPLRSLISAAGRRWSRHALLYAAAAICCGLVLRVSPVVVAMAVESSRYGVLNGAIVSHWLRFALALLAIDFFHYANHRLFHATHWLWAVHQVHHSDRDFDVSTAVRFHPIEVLITQGLYLGVIALLAPPPAAVAAYGLAVVAWNLFVHANQSLPRAVERAMRWVVITPDVHRIHHSEEFADQHLNFGEIFPWWDRLFRTYSGTTANGSGDFATGLSELRGVDTMPLRYMITAPFRRLP